MHLELEVPLAGPCPLTTQKCDQTFQHLHQSVKTKQSLTGANFYLHQITSADKRSLTTTLQARGATTSIALVSPNTILVIDVDFTYN